MKSVAIFALTCLSAAVLLAGCGGGGGGGGVSLNPNNNQQGGGGGTSPGGTPGNPSPPRSLSPLTKDAPSNLPATVTGPTGSHPTFLSTPQSDGSGGSVTVTQLNPNAMFTHYSSGYGTNAKVTTANREFLAIPSHLDAGLLGWDDYAVLRNSADGVAPPAIAVYDITTAGGRIGARVSAAVTLRVSYRVNQTITLATGVSQITAAVHNAGLRLGDNNVVFIRNGYSANVHSPLGSGDLEEGYRLFVKGEYASFYLRIDETASHREPWGDSYSGGIFTDYSRLPTLSPVTYNIRHAMGTYNERNAANNRLLSGNGFLRAGFNSRRVTLSLGIFDHNGDKFMDVNNLGMSIHARRNQFLCSGAGDSSSCTGSIDYAVDASVALSDITDFRNYNEDNGFHNAVGSFYGPNYEEVAGGFIHRMTGRSDGNNAWLNLGFIGRKVGALPHLIRPAPVVGALSPLPSSAYVSVSGITEIRRDALIDFYNNTNLEVTDANREFFMFGARWNDEEDGNYNNYRILRNSDKYLESPSFVTYWIRTPRATATISVVATLGALLTTSESINLLTGQGGCCHNQIGKTVTVGMYDTNKLRLGASTITVDSGYGLRVFDTDPGASYGTLSYFIDGQYAGLYMGSTLAARRPDSIYTYGGRTGYGNIPPNGNLYYGLHVMGSHKYSLNERTDSRLLSGSGALYANLGSSRRAVNLSLRVFDDTGDEFLSMKDFEMTLDSSRNGFRCAGSVCQGYIRYADNIRIANYFDDIDARGWFYGPNAEEVAGRLSDGDDDGTGFRVDLGFIGKRGVQPGVVDSPAPATIAFIPRFNPPYAITVGAVSPLPRSAYITVNGTTQIRRNALIDFYTSHGSGGRMTHTDRQFFVGGRNSSSGLGENDANYNTYTILHNSGLYRAYTPSFVVYGISPGQTIATVRSTVSISGSPDFYHGHPKTLTLRVGFGGYPNYTRSTKTIKTGLFNSDDGLHFGENVLTIGSGFRTRAYDTDPSHNRGTISYFIDGQYAGLYLGFHLQPLRPTPDAVHSYGVRTGYSNIPKSGDLVYDNLHVMGSHKYSLNETSNRSLLSGHGRLHANLGSSRAVNLSMYVVDDQGDYFMSMSDVQMTLDSSRGRFYCEGIACAGYIRYIRGTGLGSNFRDFDARGAFYGPNAEEVAGRISHTDYDADGDIYARVDLGFIGRRNVVTPSHPVPTRIPNPNPMTPILSVGAVSPLSANAYIAAGGGTTRINPDRLFNYYSSLYDADDKAADANLEFLAIPSLDFGGLLAGRDDSDFYIALRNPANGSTPPAIIAYEIGDGQATAYIVGVATLGAQIDGASRSAFTLNWGNSSNTLQGTVISSSELRLGASTLTISDGYSARAYSPNPNSNPAFDFEDYSFFIDAEYSALYLGLNPSPTVDSDLGISDPAQDPIGRVYSGGVFTDYSVLATLGSMTYSIDHALGAYTDGTDLSNNRVLSGRGTLWANFHNRAVELSLSVFDHNGSLFMNVDNLQMSVDPNRNQFHCRSNGSSRCGGSIDYADGIRLQDIDDFGNLPASHFFNVNGSFYGPDAEEVAGGMSHTDLAADGARMDLGFIGKEVPPFTTSPSPIPAPQPPGGAPIVILPNPNPPGNTLGSGKPVTE